MARDRRRVMLEAGPKLDIRKLSLKANTSLWMTWSYTTGLVLTIRVTTGERWGTMDLEHGTQRQSLHLEGLPCPYGGVRWFALCPRTSRRVLTLWQPPGSPIFASRHTWPRQVAYATQFEDAAGRAWSAKRRVARRLGSTDANDYDLRRRPRGMRRRTYDRLAARYWEAEDRLDDAICGSLARLLRRYGKIDFGT
jgi:hypothetical protein